MKAVYVCCGAVIILAAVACSDPGKADYQDMISVPAALTGPGRPFISLDSFQRSISCTLPEKLSGRMPGSSHFIIRREKDTITLSGAVLLAQEDKSHRKSYQAYRFYFKASSGHSYAYLRYMTHYQSGSGYQKLLSREAGYHLSFGNDQQHAG